MDWIRALRATVLASIGIGAALGVIALIVGDIGEPGWKIVTTSFLITGAALVAMPSVAAWERDRLTWLPMAGVAASVVGFAWLIVAIWVEFDADPLFKTPMTLIICAVAVGAVSLVEFARLGPRQHWLILFAWAAVVVVATLIVFGMWFEIDAEVYWRIFGVAAVLMTAALAAIPVLHRSQPSSAATTAFCPVCGADSRAPEGKATTCVACSSRYTVDLAPRAFQRDAVH